MEINKIVCINNNHTKEWCRYLKDWNRIPVFITCDGADSRSALYKDGTSFFIISGSLVTIMNDGFVYNRLWHEVAHLFFQDVWKPWDIHFEFRADLIASAATSRNLTLSRLYQLKKTAGDTDARERIERRLENLYGTQNTYSKESALYMLRSLKPVTVLR